MKIIVSETPVNQVYHILTGAIAPRPICFASTIDKEGRANLSPFSFFNVMSGHPPLLVFSPLRRFRNNTTKHSLENSYETQEVVVNVVNYAMVQQMSLTSCEFPKGVDEFTKGGFSKLDSDFVKPFRVAESPVQFECKVKQIIATGEEGGAGNLIICEVLAIHINDEVLNSQQQIDPYKIDLVARMGNDYYCRANGDAIFTVPKPNTQLAIGFDSLPEGIRHSAILTGNDLGMLANVHEMPSIDPAFNDETLKQIIQYYAVSPAEMEKELHKYAKTLLQQDKVTEAWQVLLADDGV